MSRHDALYLKDMARACEKIARATMEMIRLARPDLNGAAYGVGTDFTKFAPAAG